MNEASTVTRPADEPSPPEAVAKTQPRRFWPSLVLALLVGVSLLGFLLRTPGPAPKPATAPAAEAQPGLQDQVDALRLRVIVLEAQAAAAPARNARPRAAAPVAGSPVTATEPQPSAPAPAWGTTDLDREIADFTESLNQETDQ